MILSMNSLLKSRVLALALAGLFLNSVAIAGDDTAKEAEKADRAFSLYSDSKAPIRDRRIALETLGRLKDSRALPICAGLIRKDLDGLARDDRQLLLAAVEAVGWFGAALSQSELSDEIVNGLFVILQWSGDRILLQRVGGALARLASAGLSGIFENLRAEVYNEKSKGIAEAAEALGRIGDSRATQDLVNVMLQSRDWRTRSCAARALRSLKPVQPSAVDGLFEAIRSDSNDYVRDIAAEVLFSIHRDLPEAERSRFLGRIFAESSAEGSRESREQGGAGLAQLVWLLGRLGSAEGLTRILSVVSHPDEKVRAEVSGALGVFSDRREALEALEGLLGDRDTWVRHQSLRAFKTCLKKQWEGLDRGKRSWALSLLADRLGEKDIDLRRSSLQGILERIAPDLLAHPESELGQALKKLLPEGASYSDNDTEAWQVFNIFADLLLWGGLPIITAASEADRDDEVKPWSPDQITRFKALIREVMQ